MGAVMARGAAGRRAAAAARTTMISAGIASEGRDFEDHSP